MDLMEAIYGRRAVREFTSQPVDENQIQTLIDAALHAPSAMNEQPWRFSVVRNQDLLLEVSSKSKAHLLRSSPAGLVAHHLGTLLGDEAFHIFYHAPAMILISANEDSQWAQIDCALAAQNLMLAAYGMGLGTCWIGLAQGWLATDEGRAALGLPAGQLPVAPIIVGHPKNVTPPTTREQPHVNWLN